MLTRSYNQEKDEFNWDEVEKCLEFLSDFDWRKNGEFEGRTGSAGGSVISRELKRDILSEEQYTKLWKYLEYKYSNGKNVDEREIQKRIIFLI